MTDVSILTAMASLIFSFEASLVTRFEDASPPPSFIRRRIALLAFKQKYPDTAAVGDQLTEEQIDQEIRLLKQSNPNKNSITTDDVLVDCLIRSNFDQVQALDRLINNPPNLVRHSMGDCLDSIDSF